MPLKIKSVSGSVTLDAQNISGDQTLTVPSIAGGKTLLTTDGDGSSLTGIVHGVDGISSASSSGTAINIASDNDVGVRGAPDANTTLQVNSGSGEKGLHLKQTGNSGGAFAKFVRVSSGDTSNGHWELHHESKHLTFKTNASGGSISSPTLTDVFKVCQDGRGISQFTAKAWINFNGTGTVAIIDSHNISSISDQSTGKYRINFANATANGNYTWAGLADYISGTGHINQIQSDSTAFTPTTATFELNCMRGDSAWTFKDSPSILVQVFGD